MGVRVEIVRAFYFEGAARQAGEVLVVSRAFASELFSLGKARPEPQKGPAPVPEQETKPTQKRRYRRAEAVTTDESEA